MDNFDVYKWKQNSKQSSKNNQEFDVYKWNVNRYLNEGVNDREIKGKLSDLTYDFLSGYFSSERFNAPNPDDSSRTIYSQGQWEDWKEGIMKRFGDVDVKLDNQGYFDSDKFDILDKEFKKDQEGYIQSKAAALDKIRQRTNFGLDEQMDGGSLFDYFNKKYVVDDHFHSDDSYIVKREPSGKDQYVIFDYDKDKDQFQIRQMGGYRIDREEAIKAGMRETSSLARVGMDAYMVDGNYSPTPISIKGLKDVVDHVMGGLDREAAAQQDYYARRGPVSGTIDEIKETIKFIKENNPEFTVEEIATELKEIKKLGSQLEEKLCPKGEAYRKRRMAAGEKSSAYLSGRAVKVCKGQMSGRKKKKKK